jgi:outer membrane protein
MPTRHAALLAALSLAIAHAQAADLNAIYRDALTSDPAYQSARYEYQAAQERSPQARAGLAPSVTASASISESRTHLREPAVNPLTGQRASNDSGSGVRSYGVSLSQPIYRRQNAIAIDQADLVVKSAEAKLADARQDLIVRVAQAYFDVLLAQDNVAFSAAQKKAFGEQLAQAKRNFEVGTATIVDTLEAQARFDQTVAREIADRNDQEVKQRALEQLIGKPAGALAPLREPLLLEEAKPNRLDEWIRASDERSFAIAQARYAREIAALEINRTKAAHLPTLDATGSLGASRSPTESFGPLGPNVFNASIGLTLAIPLYTGGLNESRVREALANKEKSDQDYERTRRAVNQSVRTFFLAVTSGTASVRALEQALASTQKQLESTILGRDVGVRTSVDVLNAQQAVFQTRRDLQQARYNYLLATLRLKSASGDLKDSDLEEVNRALAK